MSLQGVCSLNRARKEFNVNHIGKIQNLLTEWQIRVFSQNLNMLIVVAYNMKRVCLKKSATQKRWYTRYRVGKSK